MTKFSALKPGEKLSETQYYSVNKIVGDEVELQPESGESVIFHKKYVEGFLVSADQYQSEEKVNRTEIIQKFMANPRIGLTVNFNTKVDEKQVLAEVMNEIGGAKLSEIETAVKKAIKKSINGEPRTMVGRHFGDLNEFGRVNFIDMNEVKDASKPHDSRVRQVDPRTINWLVVNNVKYVVK